MKFIDKYYAEDRFRSKPYGSWCPYELGYEDAPKEKDKCPKAVGSCRDCWNREMPEPKANDFPGFEINDVVQLRDGKLYIILPNNRSEDNKSLFYTYKVTKDTLGSGLICLNYCSDYTGYIHKKNCLNDVIKLWRATPENALPLIGYFFNKKEIPDHIKPIWVEPTAPTAKKMTLKEIEKELGYSIEIIS